MKMGKILNFGELSMKIWQKVSHNSIIFIILTIIIYNSKRFSFEIYATAWRIFTEYLPQPWPYKQNNKDKKAQDADKCWPESQKLLTDQKQKVKVIQNSIYFFDRSYSIFWKPHVL